MESITGLLSYLGLWEKEMDLQSLIKKIQDNLTDDLLKPQYRDKTKNRFWGHCYVASETFYYLVGGKESGYAPRRIKVNGINHWFLQHLETDEIVDITSQQFDFDIDYSLSKKASFLTQFPSKRSLKLMEKVLN